jgi:aminoglycoside phosphotransferase
MVPPARNDDGELQIDGGDRWRDMALCAHDIGERWGVAWGERFIELCGGDPGEEARSFYVLLDEFF